MSSKIIRIIDNKEKKINTVPYTFIQITEDVQRLKKNS